MATDKTTESGSRTQKRPTRSLAVRKAAAKAAVSASAKTGRPVDPRVKELADSP